MEILAWIIFGAMGVAAACTLGYVVSALASGKSAKRGGAEIPQWLKRLHLAVFVVALVFVLLFFVLN